MATNRPYGFKEINHLGGSWDPAPVTRPTSGAGDNSDYPIFPGEPVQLASGQYVSRMVVAATAASFPLLGIVRACYSNSNGKPRPLTHNAPVGPYLQAGVAGWVEVNIDPHQLYVVATDTTVTAAVLGQYATVTIGAANTAAGISGMMLKINSTDTASALFPFQIVDVAPVGDDRSFVFGGSQDVVVKIANHVFGTLNISDMATPEQGARVRTGL